MDFYSQWLAIQARNQVQEIYPSTNNLLYDKLFVLLQIK